jgi:hypothetical protein
MPHTFYNGKNNQTVYKIDFIQVLEILPKTHGIVAQIYLIFLHHTPHIEVE